MLVIAQQDDVFFPVYCVSIGKFATIKQMIGLNRAYLFNYFSFAGGLQIRGLPLCLIRGFLLQIKFVTIMNRNNKDCTSWTDDRRSWAMNKSCFQTSCCSKDIFFPSTALRVGMGERSLAKSRKKSTFLRGKK